MKRVVFLCFLFLFPFVLSSCNYTDLLLTDISRCSGPKSICQYSVTQMLQFSRSFEARVYWPTLPLVFDTNYTLVDPVTNVTSNVSTFKRLDPKLSTWNLIVTGHYFGESWDSSLKILGSENVVVDFMIDSEASIDDLELDYLFIGAEIRFAGLEVVFLFFREMSLSPSSSWYGFITNNSITFFMGYSEMGGVVASLMKPNIVLKPPRTGLQFVFVFIYLLGLILISPSFTTYFSSSVVLKNLAFEIPVLIISSSEDCQRPTYSHTSRMYSSIRPLVYPSNLIPQHKLMIEYQLGLSCSIWESSAPCDYEFFCATPKKSTSVASLEILNGILQFSRLYNGDLSSDKVTLFQQFLDNSSSSLQYLEYWMLTNSTLISHKLPFVYRQLVTDE